jgi:hypothetical protein
VSDIHQGETPIRPGRALEQLVATLERVLNVKSGNVTIESPKKLPDRVTSQPREHDVVLTLSESHHKIVVAIECKDWSQPVGTEVVEAFITKCRDTGVDKGIIVSPSGFTEPARQKAEHNGFRCLELERVESFDWFGPGEFQVHNIAIPKIDMMVIPQGPVAQKPTRFEIYDGNGQTVSAAVLESNVRLVLQDYRFQPGIVRQGIQLLTPGFVILDLDRQERHPIVRIDVVAEIATTVTKAPFDKVVYKEEGGKKVISEAAVAEVSCGGATGKLVFSNEGEKGTQIAFVITKPPAPPQPVVAQTVFEAPKKPQG